MAPNSPILISTEPASLAGNICEAKISFRMLPEPQIVFEGEYPIALSGYFDQVKDGQAILSLTDRAVDIPVLLTSRAFRNGKCTFTALALDGVVIGDQSKEAVRVEFEVLNFPALHKRGPRTEQDPDVELSAGEWLIHLRSKSNVDETIKGLKEVGGFAPTLAGTLQRTDGNAFDYHGASEVLNAVYNFLSFSRGYWTHLILPVAYDRAGLKVCEEWRVRNTTNWRGIESWLPSFGAEPILASVFPMFWRQWHDPIWREALELAIYWYLGSNKGESGAEGSIVLTQTALELLSWTVLVKDKRVLDKGAFSPGKLSGADKMRLLLHTLGIPLVIPSELSELKKISSGRNWPDGPAAFVGLRNSIVHPGDQRTFTSSPGLARVEAMNLGQWYLELVLLKSLGYTGEYRSRVADQRQPIDQVP